MTDIKRIVLFASGSGSNAENIINFFASREDVKVVHLFSNKSDAFALERAKRNNIPTSVFSKEDFYNNGKVLNQLASLKCDLIVLAGFLWLVPASLVAAFPNRIINIHPALLPKYGGKGMYGDNVHKAVVAAKEALSGITIHYVNEKYDDGNIIFQATCDVLPNDTAEDVAQKVHQLEYKYFPKVIDDLLELL